MLLISVTILANSSGYKSGDILNFYDKINNMKKGEINKIKKTIELVNLSNDIHDLSYNIENVANELWEYSKEENGEIIDELNYLYDEVEDFINDNESDEYWEDDHSCSVISSEDVTRFKLKFYDIIKKVIW